jgi:hypothetical protein
VPFGWDLYQVLKVLKESKGLKVLKVIKERQVHKELKVM